MLFFDGHFSRIPEEEQPQENENQTIFHSTSTGFAIRPVYYLSTENSCNTDGAAFDEYDAFALNIVLALREMTPDQCIKAIKEINDVIAKGLRNEL